MSKLIQGTALAAAVCSLAFSLPALARHDGEWTYAKVVRAEPVYRHVHVRQPREVCHEEPVTERVVYRAQPDPGAVLFGAVIGGVIGHQFGGGHGRDAATAAGAVLGAQHAAAHSYQGRRVVERTAYETTCRTVREVRHERILDGYDVTYRYRGRLYHTFTSHDPGKRIRIRVDVRPYQGLD